MALGTLLLILLVIALIGAVPAWPIAGDGDTTRVELLG